MDWRLTDAGAGEVVGASGGCRQGPDDCHCPSPLKACTPVRRQSGRLGDLSEHLEPKNGDKLAARSSSGFARRGAAAHTHGMQFESSIELPGLARIVIGE